MGGVVPPVFGGPSSSPPYPLRPRPHGSLRRRVGQCRGPSRSIVGSSDDNGRGARRPGPAVESMCGFVLWLVPTVEKFPRRQKVLLVGPGCRRASTRFLAPLAGISVCCVVVRIPAPAFRLSPGFLSAPYLGAGRFQSWWWGCRVGLAMASLASRLALPVPHNFWLDFMKPLRYRAWQWRFRIRSGAACGLILPDFTTCWTVQLRKAWAPSGGSPIASVMRSI